ncbi:hypothetical protein D3C75_920680 [compost metagenome]
MLHPGGLVAVILHLLNHMLFQNEPEQLILALHIVIDGAFGHARALDNLLKRRILAADLSGKPFGSFQYSF